MLDIIPVLWMRNSKLSSYFVLWYVQDQGDKLM